MTREHGLCQQAEMYYYACLEKDWSDIPDEVLQHLDTCRHCQSQMSQLCAVIKQVDSQTKPSADILTLHHRLTDQWVCCDHVRPFLPLLAMEGQAISVVTPVTAHIDRCPDCANDYQKLLQLQLSADQLQDASHFLAGRSIDTFDKEAEIKAVLEAMLTRPSSSVATRTSVRAQADLAVDGDIQFEIEQAERLVSSETEPAASPEPVRLHPRRAYPIGRVASIAAMLMIAAYLLIQIHPASVKGLGIEDVYTAMGKIVNVCIKTSASEEEGPIQTVWISNSTQTIYSQTKEQTIFWDMSDDSISGKGDSDVMQLPWGLLPFKTITEIPEDYEWVQVESIRNLASRPVLVYDYTWQEGTPDFYIQRKWRGYLDPKTKLPQRIEWWDRLPGREFEVMTVQTITYPTDQELKEAIAQSRALAPSP